MDKKTKKALERVIDYLDDERRHYLDNPCKGHIYNSVVRLDKWLQKEKQEQAE